MSQTCSVISAWIILTRMNTKSYLSSIYTQSSMWTRQGCLLASVVVIHVRTAVRAGEGIHPAPRSPSFGNCASGSSESVCAQQGSCSQQGSYWSNRPSRTAMRTWKSQVRSLPLNHQQGVNAHPVCCCAHLTSACSVFRKFCARSPHKFQYWLKPHLLVKNLGWGQHCPGWLRAGNETPPSHTLPRPEMKEHCTECYWFTASLTPSHEYQWEFYSWLQRECDWAQHTIQLSNLSKWENNFITRHSTPVTHRCCSKTTDTAAVTTQECQKNKTPPQNKQEGKKGKQMMLNAQILEVLQKVVTSVSSETRFPTVSPQNNWSGAGLTTTSRKVKRTYLSHPI